MLAASHRMRRAADFSAALRGRRAGSRCLVLALELPVPPGTGPRRPSDPPATAAPIVGFVVSRAVGGATTRNLIRRRLRHAVAGRLAALPAGSRLVVRALPAAADASYAELVRDLESTLARLCRPVAPGGGGA